MRILYIIKSLEKGGAERYVLDLCNELNRRKDVEYLLLVLQPGNDYEFLTENVNYLQLDGPYVPSLRKKTFVNIKQYQEIVDNFKPDIIHTHLFRAELFSALYLPANTAFVTHGHDNMVEFKNLSVSTFSTKRNFTNFFEKSLLYFKKYRKINRMFFVVNSGHTKDYFEKTVHSKFKYNVRLLEYGIDFKRFYNTEKTKRLKGEKLKIVNIGSLVDKKNQKLLIEIAKELSGLGVDFEMNILGEGKNRKELQLLINRYNLYEKVKLRGNVDEVEKYLWESDIYLHSAYYEPFGLVILEAMAAGLPCIILNGKGNKNLVKNNETGFVLFEENPAAFTQKISELMEDGALYQRLSENACDFAKTYSIEKKTEDLIQFYTSILS